MNTTMTIQDNIKACDELRQKIKDHPMHYEMIEDKNYITVILPYLVRGMGGFRVLCADCPKQKALQVVLDKLEDFWILDNPVLYYEHKLNKIES